MYTTAGLENREESSGADLDLPAGKYSKDIGKTEDVSVPCVRMTRQEYMLQFLGKRIAYKRDGKIRKGTISGFAPICPYHPPKWRVTYDNGVKDTIKEIQIRQ